MKVLDAMMRTPYCCEPGTNLGSATELMWKGNCGFLPVVESDGKVVGVVTDRDICVALGTRGRPSGEITVREVMTSQVHSCKPEDDVHVALRTMRDGRVRRLAVIDKSGVLAGVISMDDILLRVEAPATGKNTGVTSEEIVNVLQAINSHHLALLTTKQAAA